MPVELPEDKNPYAGRSPFDILGVPPTASAAEIRDACAERKEEINYNPNYDDKTRLAKRKEVEEANNMVREAKRRVAIEVFVFDKGVGQNECREAAQTHKTLSFEFDTVLKGTDEIFPSSPDIRGAETLFRDVTFQRSVRLKTEGHQFEADPRAEALASISFDQ